MKRYPFTSLICAMAVLCSAAGLYLFLRSSHDATRGAGQLPAQPASTADAAFVKEAYGKLAMNFEPNVGQTDEAVRYLARGQGYSLFLSQKEATLSLQRFGKDGKVASHSAVRMTIAGASDTASIDGEEPREGRSNYFIGSDPAKWRTDVQHYSRVRYRSVYDGIDLVYYGNGQQLEYDFVVRPDRDPRQIKLKFEGVESASIDKSSGDLVLETGSGTIRQLKPFVYQEENGARTEIASTYDLVRDGDTFDVSFRVADYDRSRELVIDPILSYGTYLGGTQFDEGRSITVDAEGNAYVVGTAASRDFPTTPGTIKPTMLPRTDAPNSFWYDAFVTKINPTGTALVF
jgi:hypothetical protein